MFSENFTWNETFWIDDIDFEALNKVHLALYSLNVLIGLPLNVWLLLLIATSGDLRARMRNKVISFVCVQHLAESCVLFPLIIDLYRRYRYFRNLSCSEISVFFNVQLINDFVSNWNVFILILFYAFQLYYVQPCRKLPGKAVTSLTLLILLSPWFFSLILTPSVMTYFHSLRPPHENSTEILSYLACLQPTGESYVLYKSLDTALPLFSATFLLGAGLALRKWQMTRGDMSAELINEDRPEVESAIPYTAVLGLTYVCDFGVLLAYFRAVVVYETYENYIWWEVSEMLENMRVILFTCTLFIFKDIREAAKKWRPWNYFRSFPDVTVNYRKDSSE